MQMFFLLSNSRKWESWILNPQYGGFVLTATTELGQVASLPRRGSVSSTALGLEAFLIRPVDGGVNHPHPGLLHQW